MPWQQAAGGFAVAHRTLRPGVIEVVWTQAGRSLQVRGVIAAFQDDPTLRRLHRESLAAAAFPALFWETGPTDRLSADTTPFREVLVAAPALAPIQPDPTAFADHFTTTEQVAAFPSLGGDALLLAPSSAGPSADSTCGHLAAFVRGGDPDHVDARSRQWAATGADS